jgi:hypothetical protein
MSAVVGHDHPMPTKQRPADRASDSRPPGIGKFGTRLLEISENVVYAGIATFLVGTALVCLVLAGKTTWELTSDFSEQPILDLLDVLLLVFIVVELLFAVRSTVEKRELLAEPFLLWGSSPRSRRSWCSPSSRRRRSATARSSTTGSPRSRCWAFWCSSSV